MAIQEDMSAPQDVHENNTRDIPADVAEITKRHYKVQLQNGGSTSKIWIPVKAGSEGEAFIIADTRTLDSKFHVCEGSVTEITQREYHILINSIR